MSEPVGEEEPQEEQISPAQELYYKIQRIHLSPDTSSLLTNIQKVLAIDGFRNPLLKILDQRLLLHYFDSYFSTKKSSASEPYVETFPAELGQLINQPLPHIVRSILSKQNESVRTNLQEISKIGLAKLLRDFREFDIDAAIGHARIIIGELMEIEEKSVNAEGLKSSRRMLQSPRGPQPPKPMVYSLNREVYESVFKMLLTGGNLISKYTPVPLPSSRQSVHQQDSSRNRKNQGDFITSKLSVVLDTEESRIKGDSVYQKQLTSLLQTKLIKFAQRKEPVNSSLSQTVSTPSQVEKRRDDIRLRTIRLIRRRVVARLGYLSEILQAVHRGEN